MHYFVIMSLLGLAFTANAQANVASQIDAILTEASADGSGFGLIVEIDGEVLLSRGYGYADRERKTLFTPQTIAQIGSLTKQFTATAVLLLAEAGEVDLSSSIATYIPGIDSSLANATIAQLLTHSSGLAENCGSDDFEELSRDKLVAECLNAPPAFAPGTHTAYSNVGYAALGAIIEYVTGERLEDVVDTTVLRKTGLNDTGYFFTKDKSLAKGYLEGRDMGNIENRITKMGDNWWNLKGNGGMQASTLDMYAWYKVLDGGGELPETVRTTLTSPQTPWNEGIAEGYGWYFRDDGTGRVRQMSHSGSDGVFFSYYWHRPEDGVFMYFVGNSGEEPAKAVLRQVLSLLRSEFVD